MKLVWRFLTKIFNVMVCKNLQGYKILKKYFLLGIVNDIPKVTLNLQLPSPA